VTNNLAGNVRESIMVVEVFYRAFPSGLCYKCFTIVIYDPS